jgi:hypothetical protein
MRRPRRHRLTGSTPRLLAAAAISILAAGSSATVVLAASSTGGPTGALTGLPVLGGLLGSLAKPAASASPSGALPVTTLPSLSAGSLIGFAAGDCLLLCPPVPLPTLPPLPTAIPTLPPPPVTPPCQFNCPGPGPGPTSGGTTPQPTAAPPVTPQPSQTGAAASVVAPGASAGGPGAGAAVSQQAGGLELANPPPVEQLTPLAGISFGQAPYVWPLFMLLDVVAAVAVVIAVRKTWSTADAD